MKSAVWSSTAHNGELTVLETLYPKTLCEFFTDVCGVQRKPSVAFLCEMITELQGSLTTKLSDSDNMKTWKKKLLPLLTALSKKVKKRSLSKTELKETKKTLKSTPWLPVRSVGGSSNGVAFWSSKDSPVQATTEKEKKLQKLLVAIAKEASSESSSSKKRKDGDDIKLVQLEDDGDLDALLSIARISTLTAHLEAEASVWCKVLARFTKSSQLDNKKGRKKLLKLLQSVVRVWSSALSMASSSDITQLQRSVIFRQSMTTTDGLQLPTCTLTTKPISLRATSSNQDTLSNSKCWGCSRGATLWRVRMKMIAVRRLA